MSDYAGELQKAKPHAQASGYCNKYAAEEVIFFVSFLFACTFNGYLFIAYQAGVNC
jgi:hypothetical protein